MDTASRVILSTTQQGDWQSAATVCIWSAPSRGAKNQRKEVAAYRITGEQVERVSDWVQGNDWALKIRAKVAELLDSKPNPLAGYSTEDLLAELRSRGVEC